MNTFSLPTGGTNLPNQTAGTSWSYPSQTWSYPWWQYQPLRNFQTDQIEQVCAAYNAKLITRAEARKALQKINPTFAGILGGK